LEEKRRKGEGRGGFGREGRGGKGRGGGRAKKSLDVHVGHRTEINAPSGFVSALIVPEKPLLPIFCFILGCLS
jgi:hypothetical protein